MNHFPSISRALYCLLLVAAVSLTARSQTTLAPGDLVFTSYNSTAGCPNDSFSFVLLTNISNGTIINFTDRSYTSSGFVAASGTEGSVSWTSSSALPQGTEVLIASLSARINGVVNGTVTLLDGTCAAGLSLSTGGDQLFAYQGALAPANLISGLHFGNCPGFTTDATWDNSGCTGQSASNLPPGLTPGFSSLWVGLAAGNLIAVQGAFNCINVPASGAATVRSAVYDKNNWAKSNSATGELPTPSGCSFFVPLNSSWVRLEGRYTDGAVQLLWTAAGQENAAEYIVERSEDGRSFAGIARIVAIREGGGSEKTYQYTDAHIPTPAMLWYRVKVVKADGSAAFSAAIAVRVTSPWSRTAFSLSQNIADGSAVLSAGTLQEGPAEITITDVAGRVLAREKWHIAAGRQTHVLPRVVLAGQLYLVNVLFNGEAWTGKVTGW